MEKVSKNIRMVLIIKEILLETKDMELGNFSTKISLFILVSGRKANFMEKEIYFTT